MNKSAFQPAINNKVAAEPMHQCEICRRRVHGVCVIYFEGFYAGGFVCRVCRENYQIKRPPYRRTAKSASIASAQGNEGTLDLPHCQLSQHIEDRLNDFYQYAVQSPEFKDVKVAPRVFVRVLSCAEHTQTVNLLMKDR